MTNQLKEPDWDKFNKGGTIADLALLTGELETIYQAESLVLGFLSRYMTIINRAYGNDAAMAACERITYSLQNPLRKPGEARN
jgi:hypothetical protein